MGTSPRWACRPCYTRHAVPHAPPPPPPCRAPQVSTNLASAGCLALAPEQALHEAMLATNSQLHASPIDDSLSGTTACCALLAGAMLYIANVGDSRAVLAERRPPTAATTAAASLSAATATSTAAAAAVAAVSTGSAAPPTPLAAHDLSRDQTPFRQDECQRVRQAGARVLTLDQLEGLKDASQPCWTSEADCDGDPPRLWSPNGLYPGTAFTRSIGDSGAGGGEGARAALLRS